ncbi:hypothetical protein M231_00669 [Tremella mesenterica]|uniref:Uncharacterized protein n=1 Tax=Tremella mesenterica TaxID=5217 RepID=A0A4Q1BV66_TREME|nr:uncharacterized protein TREMEDRAFT_30284 [Tremella mesenterica DSM 1558]EIW70090.1 hypothetical protein TREMEDRAFT_30284 [Tremella mesenterica DSM 1558]RXK41948.1 hypothetical protein M231_00669 [Tremella mesenterica]
MSPTLHLRTPFLLLRIPSTPFLPPSYSLSKPRHVSYSLWPSKTHLRPPPSIPPPMPAIYPQRIILSDGSTFTSYTTAPSPSTVRLTRDVTNNPLWAPGSDVRGSDGGEDTRLGRFNKRFGKEVSMDENGEKGEGVGGYGLEDMEWMSEGVVPEQVSEKAGAQPGKKKK